MRNLLANVRRQLAQPPTGMVVVALLLRVAMIAYLQPQIALSTRRPNLPFAPAHLWGSGFYFGFETGAIARSLASGLGFSSPFGGHTGPTAWIAPLYPAMCAAMFKALGVYSAASALAIVLINAVFSAVTCYPIYRIAERTVGRSVGLLAGWLWAVSIVLVHWPITWVWDMAVSGFLFTYAVSLALELADRGTLGRWVKFAVLWGIAALTNPTLLGFLPWSGLWAAWRLHRQQRPWFRNAVVSAMVFFALIGPWVVRNRLVFGRWVFLRSNAGFELSLGNYHGSNGMGWFGKHPTQNRWQYDEDQRLGELGYVDQHKSAAMDFIRHYPGEFLELTGTRVVAFWFATYLKYIDPSDAPPRWFYIITSALALAGSVLWMTRRPYGAGLLLGAVLTYPIPYYLTFAQPRYRHALEPMIMLAIAYLLVGLYGDICGGRVRRQAPAEPLPDEVNEPQEVG
jgi:4-amino-4-deoxy-L-arabinose transferase-like glycosyltransferase